MSTIPVTPSPTASVEERFRQLEEQWGADTRVLSDTLSTFNAVFLALGYVGGADASLEPGVEKVAIFADDQGVPTHAAIIGQR